MASLRKMVGMFRNELREGVAYVAFWRMGRVWDAAAFWLDENDCIEREDEKEIQEILEMDPDAVIVKGYDCCPFKMDDEDGAASSISFMMAHIRWRYEKHYCQLDDFYRDYQRVAEADELEAQPIITAKRKDAEPETKKQESPQLMEAKELEHLQETTPTEDKQMICDALLPALQLTRHLDDLFSLHYDPKTEKVIADFTTGCVREVNVAADSGVAMIRDIIQQIV